MDSLSSCPYFPGQFGIPRKWYFPFQKSYWLGESAVVRDRVMSDSEIAIDDIRSKSLFFAFFYLSILLGVSDGQAGRVLDYQFRDPEFESQSWAQKFFNSLAIYIYIYINPYMYFFNIFSTPVTLRFWRLKMFFIWKLYN